MVHSQIPIKYKQANHRQCNFDNSFIHLTPAHKYRYISARDNLAGFLMGSENAAASHANYKFVNTTMSLRQCHYDNVITLACVAGLKAE